MQLQRKVYTSDKNSQIIVKPFHTMILGALSGKSKMFSAKTNIYTGSLVRNYGQGDTTLKFKRQIWTGVYSLILYKCRFLTIHNSKLLIFIILLRFQISV